MSALTIGGIFVGSSYTPNPRQSVSIGDDGTLDTVVDYDGRFGTTRCRYDSEYRSSFENDDAFLDAVAEEVEEIARFEARAWPYHNDGKERRSV
jgi:hypothetical protein